MEARLGDTARTIALAERLYGSTNDGVVITSADGTIVDVNDAYCRLHGHPREAVLGQNPRMMKSGRHPREFYEEMWRSITSDGHWEGEIWDRRADDQLIVKWLSITAVRDERGAAAEYVGVFTDLTPLRESEERAEWVATHDPLTGLPDRRLLASRYEALVAHSHRHEGLVAVLLVDLDRFGEVNDAFGHVCGDEVLAETARRCEAALREEDILGRVGGDTFLVVLSDVSGSRDVDVVADRLLSEISEPIAVRDRTAHLTASIGVALSNGDTRLEDLARNAETATARAKSAGGSRYEYFSPDMQAESSRRHAVERELRFALSHGGLRLEYQPQVDLRTGDIGGLEALVRLTTPDGDTIMPGEVVPVAERTGLAIDLGAWVLGQACDDLVVLRERGYAGRVSVNFSAHEFSRESLVDEVLAAVGSRGLSPQDLEIEITESAMISQADVAEAHVRRLRREGFGIALDDFGTGYASVSYVQRFRPTTIKVDRTFIQGLPAESSASAIVLATLVLAKGTGAAVVAEGPETEEQVRFLRKNRYTYAQGYYFSRPAPLDAVFDLLDNAPFELPGD